MLKSSDHKKPSRALISVSDKSNIIEFAAALHDLGTELISTGGTASLLLENNIPTLEVASYTGFPELMDGRVKTLHPKIFAGILGRKGQDDVEMSANDIFSIDLVVVNLYPFEKTVANPESSFEDAIENIDIGGPSLIRAAAKNHDHTIVVTNPDDYGLLIEVLKQKSAVSPELRYELAKKAFSHTAAYDAAISNYLESLNIEQPAVKKTLPDKLTLQFHKVEDLRYGENPHQHAAVYTEISSDKKKSIISAVKHQGKQLSYNNLSDLDAVYSCIKSFDEPACVIVKHTNPCGIALGPDITEAYNSAYATDPVSAFGGIIAFNRAVDKKTAQSILDRQFVEIILAPEFKNDALDVFKSKSNVRLLSYGSLKQESATVQYSYRQITGGLLIQESDKTILSLDDLKAMTERLPTNEETLDMLFAWKVVRHVKSNAVVLARDGKTVGIGAGQMSRVYSTRIAMMKAADEEISLKGAVMASDAFFPFKDSLNEAVAAGISAIIQPGGSIRDQEVIDAANEAGIAMVFTDIRHFLH